MNDTKPQNTDNKWDDSEFHQTQTPHWSVQYRRELILLAGLSVVLLLVVLWLPAIIDPVTHANNDQDVSQQTTSAAVANGSSKSSGDLESPWQEAQIAKARREAQEILAKLLDKQNSLEGMQVNLWAADAFASAMQTASEGDELYRSREFIDAQQKYQSTLAQFDALMEQSVREYDQAMRVGLEAIDQQQPQAAVDAYTLATAIRPRNQDARDGLERAQALEQVIVHLEQATNYEQQYQLNEALEETQAALKLDPLSIQAKDKLKQIKVAMADANYASAMGKGYLHIEQQQYRQAIDQFSKALKIKPQDQAARDAIVQAENQRTQNRIQQAIDAAERFEQQEQWQQAHEQYQTAQGLDKSLVSARIGALRTKARADLDQQLQKLIDNPLRLADPGVHRSAESLLSDARAVKPRGTRIDQQAEALAIAMRKALDPVTVTFRSDNQTQITIYKVGVLGLFNEHALELKPGLYTVVGSRTGYRDVREEITLQPGSSRQTFTIQCKEKISIGS